MTTLIILLIVFLGGVIALYLLLKNIAKVIFFAAVALVCIMLLYGYFIYRDFTDLKRNISVEEKVFLLADEKKLITGMIIKSFEIKGKSSPMIISADRLTEMQTSFAKGNYNKMLGDKYKLFIVKTDVLEEGLPDRVIIDSANASTYVIQVELTKSQMLKIIKSNEPLKEFSATLKIPQNMIPEEQQSDEYIKSSFFALALEETSKNKGPSFLLEQYTEGDIIIYPEGTILKTIKGLPKFLRKKLISRIVPSNIDNI
ncbi:MAG: hypothetical protein QXK37_04525 [Candidatus Woesearchaeota archaeon]